MLGLGQNIGEKCRWTVPNGTVVRRCPCSAKPKKKAASKGPVLKSYEKEQVSSS